MKPDEAEKLHKEVQQRIDNQAAGRKCSVKLEGQPEDEQEVEPLEEVKVETTIEDQKKTKYERFLDRIRFWNSSQSSSQTSDALQTVGDEEIRVKLTEEPKSLDDLKNGKNSVEFEESLEKIEHEETQHLEDAADIQVKPPEMADPKVEKSKSRVVDRMHFWKNCKSSSPEQSADNPVGMEEGNSKADDESHSLGKKCLIVFKVFVNTFGLIFLAEWGDRSQLATIVLASVNDVGGIILGSIAGHTVCTTLAVLAGALIAKKISVRAVTVIGGFVFIAFAIAAIIMGPDEPPTSETI